MFKAEYVFVRILIPFISGISLLYFFQYEKMVLTFSALSGIAFFTILVINSRYKKFDAHKFKGFTGLLLFLFFFFFGGLLCLLKSEKIYPDYFEKKKYDQLKISVNDEPEQTNGIIRFKARIISSYLHLKQTKSSGQILIILKTDSIHPIYLQYGDELIISANYNEIEPLYNPAEFNFKNWLASQNIYKQIFTDQHHVFKTNINDGTAPIRFALNLRAKQVAKYRELIRNNEAFAVASTLILGYRTDLNKETLAAYSRTGTIHALSVSGSHVAIIFFILDFLLAWLNKEWYLKTIKFLLICGLIWAYSLITGLSPSVVRAAIMITIFITAKTFAKNRNAYNTLAFAAFCQLVYNPFLIWDVGFQLSYLSVFGLIYLQPKIYKWFYIKNSLLRKIWELTALSIAAQIVTFPLCIYYFHQFPVYFLMGNLFISIPLVLIMILGIVILIPFTSSLAPVFEWIIVTTNSVLKWIADLPYSTISSVWINLPELILLSLALGLFIYALTKYNRKVLILSLIIYSCYSIIKLYENWQAAHQMKIIFFSLRKNYAAAFINGKHAMLISDFGEADKIYTFYIKPAMEQAQVNKISFLNLNQDTVFSNFIIKNNQIVFLNHRILIINEKLNYKRLITDGKFSELWFTGNTKFNPEYISGKIDYKTILIDATNKDYMINTFKRFAQNNKTAHHILKKNPAYLVNLNQ